MLVKIVAAKSIGIDNRCVRLLLLYMVYSKDNEHHTRNIRQASLPRELIRLSTRSGCSTKQMPPCGQRNTFKAIA